MSAFDFRRAEIRSIRGRFVLVDCPYPTCGSRHAHQLGSIGSTQVVAGCSTPERPRLYAIPKLKQRTHQ